ncbi:helix-turn-helix domain-containing protein [Streptacidiphilus carbonis]|jgi:DNA-binding transcriptional ArsR family regulator|uniref:helix-turn-helix domain-containing protein n=1 Tax=Streptacidiphilus carbonis TaxID=105422 RepID=UPI000693C832|nr:helix-turn-helix domain-containing protein [Streptacidiphilus carbonis]
MPASTTHRSTRTAPPARFTPCSAPDLLPALAIPARQQWIGTTTGRVATDGYSWLQAVHWVIGSGLYTPRRSHGPQDMGPTTERLAKLLADLSPCRPGIDYLVRRLGVGERTVQYHLDMLREAGLVAYIERGTRSRGRSARASHFALLIPAAFDTALGVRTTGDGAHRRITGVAEASRALLANLGHRATRRAPRAPKPKHTPPTARTRTTTTPHPSRPTQALPSGPADLCRCTPMEGGCCTCPADGSPILPPESKLAPGHRHQPAPTHRQATRGRARTLNRVGRRYQLAWELVQQVPWLNRAAVARIAWVIRDMSDAGWTTDEVLGWLDSTPVPERIHRPSAFLAARAEAAHQVITTPQQRARLAESRRDTRRATAARHLDWDGAWSQPTNPTIRQQVAKALAAPIHGTAADTGATLHGADDPQLLLDDLTRAEVADLRALAQQHPDLIRMAIETQGEAYARRLYTNAVIDQLTRNPQPSATLLQPRPGRQP